MHYKIFSADLESLREMLDFIQNYIQSRQISSSIMNKIILAAEEAIVNVIHHGYPEKKGSIQIQCLDSQPKKGVLVQIKDQGIPFNPTQQLAIKKLPEKTTTVEELELGGYGINILIKMMDKVEYQRLEKDNLLSLIKYI